MSATNRGRARRENDFYETPLECTRAILPELGPPTSMLDPCCGDGAILKVFEDAPGWWSWRHRGYDVSPISSRASFASGTLARDALSDEPWFPKHQLTSLRMVVTNPPYKLAQAFVSRALAEVDKEGRVAMLLRLPFLESLRRQSFHKKHPADVYVFAKRPSFTGDGKTDATAYAWFVWGPGRGGRWSILPHEGDEAAAAVDSGSRCRTASRRSRVISACVGRPTRRR